MVVRLHIMAEPTWQLLATPSQIPSSTVHQPAPAEGKTNRPQTRQNLTHHTSGQGGVATTAAMLMRAIPDHRLRYRQ